MKKTGNIIYIVICLIICVLPFAGMTCYKTTTTTENKQLAQFPDVTKDGKVNLDFPDELSAYFEDHFAFRQQLVSADAEIQSKIFRVSNVDTVLVGTDGWLYYTDTVNDYLAQDTMNDRQVFDTVHNLSLLQQYVKDQGVSFIFTVAPNKNSLYGEHMPYYFNYKAGDTKNMDRLTKPMVEAGLSYVNLFEPFERQPETLYLKRDSHWNEKGAVLAYNTLMDAMQWEHPTYEDVNVVRKKEEYGDLNKMIYPLTAVPEWNSEYQYESTWSYTSKDQDVEAAYLETENKKGDKNLLMFRDSFGNTLLPLMAQKFEHAVFTKSVPYRIAEYIKTCQPDLVIAEKVERNMDEFMTMPPIMQGPEITITDDVMKDKKVQASVTVEESQDDTNYYLVSGAVQMEKPAKDAIIYIRLGQGEKAVTYEAFTTSSVDTDYGYQLYLDKESIQSTGYSTLTEGDVTVIVEQNGKYSQADRVRQEDQENEK